MTRFIVLLATVGLIVTPFHAIAQDDVLEETPCIISSAYEEAIDEHTHSLSRVTLMVASAGPGSPLDNPETVSIFFRQMLSMRQYHESMRTNLPDCAQATNNAFIGAITAAQDTLAFGLAHYAMPESRQRNQTFIDRSRQYLQDQWAALNEARAATELVVLD